MSICCDDQSTRNATELTSLIEQQVKKPRSYRSCAAFRCLCLPCFFIIVFAASCIVLSTEVQRKRCVVTCTHRPTCVILIGNHTYITHEGSCNRHEEVATCHCYVANGVASINPFILVSPFWTLIAVLSGGALALFTLGLFCWCCCRPAEQTY